MPHHLLRHPRPVAEAGEVPGHVKSVGRRRVRPLLQRSPPAVGERVNNQHPLKVRVHDEVFGLQGFIRGGSGMRISQGVESRPWRSRDAHHANSLGVLTSCVIRTVEVPDQATCVAVVGVFCPRHGWRAHISVK